ncbi:MAG: class I SAM-dependent methyltransferase [Fuerstiella sp.]|nr:class I SAM-dependent methyltransferase [Fuerstiella sp.]
MSAIPSTVTEQTAQSEEERITLKLKYTAKEDYQSSKTAEMYEQRDMYQGVVGNRRVKTETNVIRQLADRIEPGSTLLDCPCGNGRWFEILSKNVTQIRATDVSKGMVEYASRRQLPDTVTVEVGLGDAEKLALADNEVDYTFSYALMKHIPVHIQFNIIKEFARVSRKGVFCSFAVLTPLSYAWWRRKKLTESFPIIREDLQNMARYAGLELNELIKVSQPLVGLEYFAVFQKNGKS